MARPVKPGPVVIPQVAQIKQVFDLNGMKATIVVHGSTGGTTNVSAALADTLLTGFKNALTTSGWGGLMSNLCSLQEVTVKDLSQAYNPEYLSSGGGQSGTGTGTPLPINTAICVSHLTNKSGAQWRGRSYLCGMDSSVTTDGIHHTSAAGTAALDYWDACMSVMATAQVPMVIAQRELLAGQDSHGNALPPRSASSAGVIGNHITSNRLDTQRRRIGSR